MGDRDWFPSRVRDLLGPVASRIGIERPIETGVVWNRWRAIVGDGIADHAEPTSLRDGVLKVRADSPAWATELSYLTSQIGGAINAAVGREIVTSIAIWTGPPMHSGTRRVDADETDRAPSITQVQADAKDAEEAFARAYRAWWKRRFGAVSKPTSQPTEKAKKPW